MRAEVYMWICGRVQKHTIICLGVTADQAGFRCIVLQFWGVRLGVWCCWGVEWVQGTQWEKLAQMEPQTDRAALHVSCTAREPLGSKGPLADMSTMCFSQ